MTEHKFTDNEIIRALGCCGNNDNINFCSICPYYLQGKDNDFCQEDLHRASLDLINRQKANLQEVITLNSKLEAELVEQRSELKILKDSNINLQELYQNEKEKVAKAKQKVIDIAKALKTAKSEAIKEFADKVIGLIYEADDINTVSEWQILNLVKEMTEGK